MKQNNIESISRWEIYTTTNKESNARKTISTFLNENPFLEYQENAEFHLYEKTNVMKVILFCKHNAYSWKDLAFDLIQSVQRVAFKISINGDINETIDLILNQVSGANGGISTIFISCDNPMEKNKGV